MKDFFRKNREKFIIAILIISLIFSFKIIVNKQQIENRYTKEYYRNLKMKKDNINILFLGNSYTYFNNMPSILHELALSAGKIINAEHITRGGTTLQSFINSEDELAIMFEERLANKQWDYIVLQEQSQIPAVEDERKKRMYPSVRILDKMIKDNGAKTILFMTWGRRYEEEVYGFKNFESMQEALRIGYTEIGKEISATISPVGLAWLKAKELDGNINLWDPDNSHPSLEGSYLAACVFYNLIFNESPVGLTYRADLSKEKAEFLQSVAVETMKSF